MYTLYYYYYYYNYYYYYYYYYYYTHTYTLARTLPPMRRRLPWRLGEPIDLGSTDQEPAVGHPQNDPFFPCRLLHSATVAESNNCSPRNTGQTTPSFGNKDGVMGNNKQRRSPQAGR